MAGTAGILTNILIKMDSRKHRSELTVIVAAVDDYDTVAEAIRAVEDQTAVDAIEILIVLDSMDRFSPPADFAQRHHRARIVETGRPLLLNEARAIGIEHAAAEFVFLLEDHCLPTRDCLAKIIERIREGRWSVIGPAMASGNRYSVCGRAANLLTYGEWMGFERAEERRFVTGYSSAWRCESLRRLAPHLERDLAIPSRLQQRLRQAGEHLFFEPGAVMLHWEASHLLDVGHILFRQGLGMGFIRQGASTLAGKGKASLLVPLLVLHRALRGARAWRRTQSGSWRVLLAIPILSLVWCTGELLGYWTHAADQAIRDVSDVERKRQPFVDAAEPIRRPWAAVTKGQT
jgi:Glycosyl transferase family 2